MKKALLISIAMLAILAMTMIPSAFSWCIPPNPAGEDNKYELYGPHVKGILIKIYANTEDEWTAMDAGQLDFEDWPLDNAWINAWSTPDGPITEQNYGGEAGYFLLDINNNATMVAVDGDPPIPNPTSDVWLRRAIAYCVNRVWIMNNICPVLPIWTPVPPYMARYVNHDIAPGGSLEALTYGGDQGNVTAADEILNSTGFPKGADGWRYWDKNHNGVKDAGEDLNLIFYSRTGHRGDFGDHFNAVLNAPPIKIHTTYHSHVQDNVVPGPVFAQKFFNLYTGGWISIGPDPDYLCDLYNGSNYYHPGSPPNYDGINYANLNVALTSIKLATGVAPGTAAALDAQVKFAQNCAAVPLWCYSGVKAYKNVPVEGGGNWTQMVNQRGFGVNSWWSTLNMYKQCDLYPNFTYYGFSSTIEMLNPVYSQWYWDWEVLGRIYDSGAARDPMTLATWIPQLYQYWEVGTWQDPLIPGPDGTKTKLTIKMRPDVFWQDGVPCTINDVYYTLVEISKDMLAKGFPPPWWYPTVALMRSIKIVDAYTIEILLDVNGVWAPGWVLGMPIIPKHIWKPIVDASTPANPIIQGSQPDPKIIGTGPFRWWSGSGNAVGTTVVLVANSPNSVAPATNPVTSPGYYQYYPVRASIWTLLEFTTASDPTHNPVGINWTMIKPYPNNPATGTGYKFKITNWVDTNNNILLDEADLVFLVNATNADLPPCFPPPGKYYTVFIVEPDPQHPGQWILKLIYCNVKFNMPHDATHPPAGTLPLGFGIELQSLWLNDSSGGQLIVNKYVYIDGVLQPGYPHDVTLVTLPDGTMVPDKEELNLNTTKCHHTITVAIHIKGPAMLDPIHPNPWISSWINVTLHYWVTVIEDIGGGTLYAYIYPTSYTILNGLPATYPYAYELPVPDCKVGIKDILICAKAFGSKPGSPIWSPIADVNKDYKVDIKDILTIAKAYGSI
jgi:ABC-type transport system substrate-binding protein